MGDLISSRGGEEGVVASKYRFLNYRVGGNKERICLMINLRPRLLMRMV